MRANRWRDGPPHLWSSRVRVVCEQRRDGGSYGEGKRGGVKRVGSMGYSSVCGDDAANGCCKYL